MKKKNCRMTDLERAQHARAVQFRKMTDAQICEYLDSLLEREREARSTAPAPSKEEEQAQALSRAISVAIKSLSKDALDYIKEISGGDTVGYLTTRIQAQISRNKGVSK